VGVEIERKFLVLNDSWRENVQDCTKYVQAYLSKEPERTVRVRIAGEKAYLTIKGQAPKDKPLETPEFEYEIPKQDAENLLPLCLPGSIDKTRHKVKYGGFTWEVDVFDGDNKGLVVAEIEIPTSGTVFDKPSWLGQEVTDDNRYKNAALSTTPYKNWPKM